MTFGKHQGKLLTVIETGYLKWAATTAEKTTPELRAEIEAELHSRDERERRAEEHRSPRGVDATDEYLRKMRGKVQQQEQRCDSSNSTSTPTKSAKSIP
jgi:hypothetical protein